MQIKEVDPFCPFCPFVESITCLFSILGNVRLPPPPPNSSLSFFISIPNPAKRVVAVGMGIAPDPPHRSVRALVSAYGSYLGYERRSVALAKDAAPAVGATSVPAGGEVVPNSTYASDSGASDYAARIG